MEQLMMNIGFGDLEFQGLKFREDKSRYPWKTKKEANDLFDALVEDGSEISQNRYKNLYQIQFEEDIHVKLSWSFLVRYFSYFTLGLVFLLTAGTLTIPALVVLGISFVSFISSNLLNRKVRDLYMGMKMNPDLVKFLFEYEDDKTK